MALQQYQMDFIDFLISKGALWLGKPGEYRTLKSKRTSPHFVDTGNLDTGSGLYGLSRAYADAAVEINGERPFDTIYGPPDKGTALAPSTASMLSPKGLDKRYLFMRSKIKETEKTPVKQRFVGDIKDGDRVLLIDDVITTGGAKYEAMEQLSAVAKDLKFGDLIIAVDRQELGTDGRTGAIKDFETKAGIKVKAIVTFGEMLPYLIEKGVVTPEQLKYINAYMRTYCIEDLKKDCRDIKIIQRDRGLIPACDAPLERVEEVARQTADIDAVTAYKVGLHALIGGLDRWVERIRAHTNKPIIYDHQKAGNDIPDMGVKFAKIMAKAGVNAAILFPFTGHLTQSEWTKALYEEGIEPIVGAEMTHPNFKVSEGGYIPDEKLVEMYLRAACSGVNNFVVPGNKPEQVEKYRTAIEAEVPRIRPTFYSPGFVKQGGKIEDAAKVAGPRWNAIVGRAIMEASDARAAALELATALE
jgi:orotidine-5'-phosphate decarboxylase